MTDSFEQSGHQGQGHHRRLVYDDHVVRELVAAIVAGTAAAGWVAAQQAVDGRCFQALRRWRVPSPTSNRPASSWTASAMRAAALPVGAASATRGKAPPAVTACSSIRANKRATVVVLPVPGPPAMTLNRRDQGIGRGLPLGSGTALRKKAGEAAHHGRLVDRRRQCPVASLKVGGDGSFVAPIAVQVKRAADQAQRAVISTTGPAGHKRAPGQGLKPSRELRPGQTRQVGLGLALAICHHRGSFRGDRPAQRRQFGQHMAGSRRPHGQSGGEDDRGVAFPTQTGQCPGHVNIRRGQHTGAVTRSPPDRPVRRGGRARRSGEARHPDGPGPLRLPVPGPAGRR